LPTRWIERIKTQRALRLLPLFVVLVTCGPPLSDPSPLNITGRWISDAQVGPITEIVMDVNQKPNGDISGNWSGKATPSGIPCWSSLGTTPSGSVAGSYTEIRIAVTVEAIGVFQGQKISPSEIRGTFDACGTVYNALFTLVNAPSGG
jgi:hypothetical protein